MARICGCCGGSVGRKDVLLRAAVRVPICVGSRVVRRRVERDGCICRGFSRRPSRCDGKTSLEAAWAAAFPRTSCSHAPRQPPALGAGLAFFASAARRLGVSAAALRSLRFLQVLPLAPSLDPAAFLPSAESRLPPVLLSLCTAVLSLSDAIALVLCKLDVACTCAARLSFLRTYFL